MLPHDSNLREIYLKDGQLMYLEVRTDPASQGIPTRTREEIHVSVDDRFARVGCTRVTREAFDEIMKQVAQHPH